MLTLLRPLMLALTLAALPLTLLAQSPGGAKRLAVGKVKINAALLRDTGEAGKITKMERMSQNVDAQLRAAFQATRSFQLVNRSDSDALLEESGATGRNFSFGDADYLVVVTVDDFADTMETKRFEAKKETVTVRTLRFAAISTIYHVSKGQQGDQLETANIDVSRPLPEIERGTTTGDTRDAVLRELTKELAEKTAQHVVDVIYPAEVVGKTGKIVTISRGEGSGIAVGDLWEVFAQGEELKNSAGVSLGREEVSVGKVRITRVNAKTTQASISEDNGIEKGAIVRPVKP
jgi:hypothetical protein